MVTVYVLISETPDDGKDADAVYASLPAAQEVARTRFFAYKEQKKNAPHGHDPEICWYSGVGGLWGWYDVNESSGCYIRRMMVIE